jgi:hypothetical protein
MKKSQNMSVWLSKMVFWPSIFALFAEAGKRCSKAAVDWLDSLLGPGGLLFVVSHPFAVPVLVLWLGLEKSKQLNLNVRNIFAGSHTEHCWRCSCIVHSSTMKYISIPHEGDPWHL